ncbi:MAG: bifunctional phosphoglucose/phosphomannose isomerase [Acidimicrobiia bacterium]|nr:bifunctional phosphoglucose/phosphomannose isomerase [Acidimicrobiia bacterium]
MTVGEPIRFETGYPFSLSRKRSRMGETVGEVTLGLAEQLATDLPELSPDEFAIPQAETALVCGMGGSAICGDLAVVLAAEKGYRLDVHRDYGLPGWAKKGRPLVLAVSYSGNTEETISAAKKALRLSLPIVAITSGGALGTLAEGEGIPILPVPTGREPRTAFGFILRRLVFGLAAAGIVTVGDDDFSEAVQITSEILRPGSASWNLADDLAQAIGARVGVIYASTGLTAPVAQRWKTQINENAKQAAWVSLLPELDHNEVVGWSALREITRSHLAIVSLRDHGEHEAVARRFAHTRSLLEDQVIWAGEVWSQGESALARMLSLLAIGDLVSLGLARYTGTDPEPIEQIEYLKRKLRVDGD